MATTPARSLTDLDISASPEPYRLRLKGGKIIAFPDPLALPFDVAEDLMATLAGGAGRLTVKEIVHAWLTPDDAAALMAAGLNMRQMVALFQELGAHYEAIFGGPGEDGGSANS